MHSKSDNTEIVIGNETNEINEEHFENISKRHESKFIFDSIDILYCNLNKNNLNRDRSFINSP